MEKTCYLAVVCASVWLLSWCLRALPFLLFGRRGGPPPIVAYVGRVLSPAAIAMLVAYCFAGYAKGVPSGGNAYFAPEVTAGIATATLQAWRRNPMLSIVVGTALYMVLSGVARPSAIADAPEPALSRAQQLMDEPLPSPPEQNIKQEKRQ